MKYIKNINTKIGKISIIEENKKIIEIKINSEENIQEKETALLNKTAKEIEEYLQGKRKDFDIPINPKGTSYMQKVWKALQTIPYGEVRTYKQIATQIGNSKASRAVGMANHNNPIPIIIPCHRVIGSNGKMFGYALGLDIKEFLLKLEKNNN